MLRYIARVFLSTLLMCAACVVYTAFWLLGNTTARKLVGKLISDIVDNV
jgi:hypothetical protein